MYYNHCCIHTFPIGIAAYIGNKHRALQSVEVEVKKGKKEPVEQLVNTQFGATKATCLHLAAKEGHRYVITFLPSP